MQPLLGHRAPARRQVSLVAATAGLIALGCVLLIGVASRTQRVALFSTDPFLKSYMGADKKMLMGRTHKTDFWRSEVENGGLFKRLHNLETSRAKAHKQWKKEQLATIVEPSSKHMLKDLDIIESRAEHAPDTRDALNNLEKTVEGETGEDVAKGGKWSANLAQWRRHADAVGPKYASNKKHPALQKELPSFDHHVDNLMHSLGEARQPHSPAASPRAKSHLAAAPSSSQQLSQSPPADPLASLLPAAILKELHQTKAAKVEDAYSMPMRDATEPSRQSANKVVRTFV